VHEKRNKKRERGLEIKKEEDRDGSRRKEKLGGKE
jgi:hypothetical protein